MIVYGAGSAGVQLATALTYSNELNPVAFVDDGRVAEKQLIANFLWKVWFQSNP